MSANRKRIFNVLRILLAVVLVYVVIQSVGWDKLVDTLSRIDLSDWVLGLSVMFVAYSFSMVRWRMLMRSVGIEATWWTAFRLGWIGAFFNNVVPGLTGGDLVKAFYVARENPNQRADAVLTVIVDRIVGIVALAVIAAVVIPFDFESYKEAALGIYGFLAAAFVGTCLVLSRRVKARLKGVIAWFGRKRAARTPGEDGAGEGESLLGKLDRAVSIYRDRVGVLFKALLMSAAVHLLIIVAIWIFGGAIAKGNLAAMPLDGSEPAAVASYEQLRDMGLREHCSIIPIIMIISAVPIAPAGWGVGEAVFTYFYGNVGLAEELALSLSLTYRLSAVLLSLIGAVFLLLDRERVMSAAHEGPDADPT